MVVIGLDVGVRQIKQPQSRISRHRSLSSGSTHGLTDKSKNDLAAGALLLAPMDFVIRDVSVTSAFIIANQSQAALAVASYGIDKPSRKSSHKDCLTKSAQELSALSGLSRASTDDARGREVLTGLQKSFQRNVYLPTNIPRYWLLVSSAGPLYFASLQALPLIISNIHCLAVLPVTG